MESQKIAHLFYCPFTGLGLYNGFRGTRWLRNRIQIFKQFVLPSLRVQTNQGFYLWISWRYEDQGRSEIKDFEQYLLSYGLKVIFTYSGVCFWDDKYPDEIAHTRLIDAIHDATPAIFNAIGEADTIYMTIQPSDDVYDIEMVEFTKQFFMEKPEYQAVGFSRGYVMDYLTLKIREWNPKTNPPFYTIKFDKKTFGDPLAHLKYTGPYHSHEYVGDKLKYKAIDKRGFIVGTHGENISTVFNHPFSGSECPKDILKRFGLAEVEPLKIKRSLRKIVMRKLPPSWQKKLRYWFGERIFARVYDFLRN